MDSIGGSHCIFGCYLSAGGDVQAEAGAKALREQVTVDEEKTVQDMAEMIRCKTVSYNDESLIDKAEFKKFQELLPKTLS